MKKYVDGFVLPIPTENIEKYREIAEKAGEIWKEHGALEYWECAGDDLNQEEMVSFKTIAGAAENETVILAWIVYESKEERDRINSLVMTDERLKEIIGVSNDKIFDYKRMAYGGFKTLVNL